jgi:phosphoesterase RecJ-like protein
MSPRSSASSRPKTFRRIAAEVRRATSILIASHEDPDPDAIGSMIGLWHILKRAFPKKRFWLYNATPINRKYWVLEGARRIRRQPPRGKFDLVIGLDAGSVSRLNLNHYLARFRPKFIFIDHHETSGANAEVVWIARAAESTSQLIYELARHLRFPIPPQAAQALLIGIAGDTLHFSLASPKVFRISAALMRKNPQFATAVHDIFGWPSVTMMRLFGTVLRRTRFMKSKRFIWSYATPQDMMRYRTKAGELAYIATALRDYIEAEVSLFLRPRPDGVWEGSLRSVEGHPTNLAKLATKLGGGGHAHASGFEIKLPKEKILKTIIQSLPNRR